MLKTIIASLMITFIALFSSQAQASSKLVPSASTASYCAHNAWGSESQLNHRCNRLHQQCASGRLKHKGCKAFVKRWNQLHREFYGS